MAIEQIDIEKFLQLSEEYSILDVRSPGEYLHAHIPGALALPLFTDDQRKIIGTAYKMQSRQVAVKKGLDFFSERMKAIPEEVEQLIGNREKSGRDNLIPNTNRVLIHCWRGGMRSGAVAWLLDLYGFKVYTLKGGYKAFRNWALAQFEKNYTINILGGYTGSGKTQVLQELKRTGNIVIDLEGLANHKGSAFGALGENPQPGQEMFENLLAFELYKATKAAEGLQPNGDMHTSGYSPGIWLEDESRHIGTVGIPKVFWGQMRKSSLYFLEIPFEERLKHIINSYGAFDKKDLVNSIMNIQKRLGGLETKNAINYLLENKVTDCFSILLRYYDKLYNNSLYNRENIEVLLNKIPCAAVDINNAQKFCSQKACNVFKSNSLWKVDH
ncbi:MAG: tRNA 2-selenouridine(34) synthase MnmH [Ginsengibacter sp.]